MDFRESAVAESWYPKLRPDRGAGGEEPSDEPIVAPRTRLFPWAINIIANARSSFSTPSLVGPAIIKDIAFYSLVTSSPPTMTLELGTSSIAVLENGVALATARPYTVLSELQDPQSQVNDAAGGGIISTTQPNTNVRFVLPLDLIITDPEFRAVIALINNSISAQLATGHLRVIEGVDRDALRFFL